MRAARRVDGTHDCADAAEEVTCAAPTTTPDVAPIASSTWSTITGVSRCTLILSGLELAGGRMRHDSLARDAYCSVIRLGIVGRGRSDRGKHGCVRVATERLLEIA